MFNETVVEIDFPSNLKAIVRGCGYRAIIFCKMNGFGDFYEQLARLYFITGNERCRSREFYAALAEAVAAKDADRAEAVSRTAMLESITSWERVNPWQ